MKRPKTAASIAEAIAAKERQARNVVTPETPVVLKFVVEGEPVGKERARVFSKANADGRVVTRAVTPEKTRAYEWHVKTMAQIAVNQTKWAWAENDVFVLLLRIYTTYARRHPDVTNVAKSVEDACNLIAWGDDRDVHDLAALLRQDAKRPRVEVEIRRQPRESIAC